MTQSTSFDTSAAEDGPAPNPEDFVSFPTLPDPEIVANRSFSTMISKTLRKVTDNASNLVHTYAAPPQNNADNHIFPDSPSLRSGSKPQYQETSSESSSEDGVSVHSEPDAASPHRPVSSKSQIHLPALPAHTPQSSTSESLAPQITSQQATSRAISSLSAPAVPLKKTDAAQAPAVVTMFNAARFEGSLPRVTADKRGLTLSNLASSKEAASLLSKNEVTVTHSERVKEPTDPSAQSPELSQMDAGSTAAKNTSQAANVKDYVVKSLQNRISSIFNNLPNDFEVSDDDSVSDMDTSESHSVSTATKPTATAARSRRSSSVTSRIARPVTPAKPKSAPTRKTSSNFSAAFLDGAKNIITTNLAGVATSTSSMVGSIGEKQQRRKKKSKASKPSENPLKNGGFPKHLWMNDKFISECLNCFKPFTAFRRKHHCRFCGQIFCGDCTTFISYSQYKEQRSGRSTARDVKSYKDKLRVCDPCYADVVVYLSDDSSINSDEDEANMSHFQSLDDIHSLNDASISSPHDDRVSGIHSRSSRSRRNSYLPETAGLEYKLSHDQENSSNSLAFYFKQEDSKRSPEAISRRFPPQMAIPTTRTGEAVEIPVSQTPQKSYHAIKAFGQSSYTNSAANDLEMKPRLSHNSRRNLSATTDVPHPNSLENLSSLYKSMVNNRFHRLPSGTNLDFGNRAHGAIAHDTKGSDPDEDGESENEDEQVMSLYSSLQHSATSANQPSRSLSTVSVSMPGVPTLNEFPTLHEFPSMDDKYIPSNLNQANAISRFEFKPTDAFNNSTINENKQRSNQRSNERAKASLRRIKDRRAHKSTRKAFNTTLRPRIDMSYPSLATLDSSGSMLAPIPGNPAVFPSDSLPKSNISLFFSKESSDLRSSYDHETAKSLSGSPLLPPGSITLEHGSPEITDLVPEEGTNKKTFSEILWDNIDAMIQQCLADCDLRDRSQQERWIEVLHKILKHLDQLKISDTLDIKQYIKIKKILGGCIEDTSAIDGLFITKNVDSKRMRSTIKNPKIALLVFPLEYLKSKEQFISLKIISSQQSLYVEHLVSRLISLEPDLVIVGDTVCGLAEKLLEEANITLISNVKPQVIERISRYTKGHIFQSINDLYFKLGDSLGTCSRFEIKSFVFQDIVKTYAFFLGSNMESGFTICLRGGDEELLSSAKYAAESLIPGVFNARFEKSFFHDFSLEIERDQPEAAFHDLTTLRNAVNGDSEDSGDLKMKCVSQMEHHGIFNYVSLFDERILSLSPSIRYPLPAPLSNVIQSFESFLQFYNVNRAIQAISENDEIRSEWLSLLRFDISLDRFVDNKDVIRTIKLLSDNIVDVHFQDFNYRCRLWSNSMKYTTYQLYPIFHKSIHFLHSRISIKHATPCYGPVVVVVDYYSDNDKCLGLFLEQNFHEAGKTCDECGDLMINHYKTYAHGNAKIDLIAERLGSSHDGDFLKESNKIFMWSHNPQNNTSTPIYYLSQDAYHLSLGKFFELNFWSCKTQNTAVTEQDFFKDHVKYFGYNDLVIRMQYSQIDNYEVVVPNKKLDFSATIDLEQKLATLKRIQESSHKFFQSVAKRLNRVKVDTSDQAEAGAARVAELKEQLNSQISFIGSKTLTIYENTSPTNFLSLNIIQRDLQELGVAWDAEFNDFEKQFLPTENEITKITQFHLRNFLMDKFDNEDKPNESTQSGEKTPKEEEVCSSVNAQEEKTEEPQKSQEQKDAFAFGSRRVPSTAIEDKIMQIKQSFESDQNKHVVKTPAKADSIMDFNLSDYNNTHGQNKVQDLTNYFNQMTLEFQRQREQVLEKQSSKYKAIPIVSSHPIVEIYGNIEDVVDSDHKSQNADPSAASPNYPTQAAMPQNSSLVFAKPVSEENKPDLKSLENQKPKLDIPQPEKNSLLKSLTNFWADRSATLWDPLEYPLDCTEHTFADSDVIVREDEPSSLVAFCLSTGDYKQKLKNMAANNSGDQFDETSDNLEFNDEYRKKSAHFAKLEKKFKKRAEETENEISELEATMTKSKFNHLRYQFVDGGTEMSCKIFYSEQFDAFRRACGVDDSFVQSLSRCIKWNSKGGKSGSNFLKTLDNRYIVKELSKSELESFVSIAPFYFKYISQSTFNTLTTAIAKIFGFYQVEFNNSINNKTFKMDFLIMENLFYNRTTTRIFDLKGSMRNRHVKQTGTENEVLLDENMIEYIYESPVFVREQSKKLLRGSLFNDTSFLSAMDVMDYSLVIGIDDASSKLYVGIIDWLRTFTWDKKVENWVKGKSLVGKGKDPTIVTPKQYRTRFREAMDRYILEVPDIWYEGSS